MKPERLIRATYADILASADPATIRVIGDLDALYTSTPIPAAPPFHALLATRARAANRPATGDGPETAMHDIASGAGLPHSRRGWLRQGFAFAGAALAFALVATILVLLFRSDDESSSPGAQPDASPTVTLESALPVSTPTPSTLASGPHPDQIAFTSIQDGNPEIYLINADGSGLTRLTDDPAADREPAWSPDGVRIAFASDRDGEQRLYVMNANGSDARLVTDEANGVAVPVWSPDGEWIAFVAFTEDGFLDIFIVHPDGSDLRRLTDSQAIDTDPAWSPTSEQIVYRSDSGPGGMYDIFIVNIDGSGHSNLTNDVISQREPQWSHDGARIAFSHASLEVDMGQGAVGFYDTIAIYNTTMQGGDPFRETDILGSSPRWSPDGHYVVYNRPASEPGTSISSTQTVHILNVDTLESSLAPDFEGAMPNYDWSPEGERLVVAMTNVSTDGNPGDERSLWLAPLDGSEPILLAEQLDSWARPAWRTDPSRTPEPSKTPPDLALPTATPDTREPSAPLTLNALENMLPLQPGQERHFVFDIRADYRPDESSFLAWNVKGSERMLPDGTVQTYAIVRDADYNVLIEYVDDGERLWLNQRGWITGTRVPLPHELGLGLLEPILAGARLNVGQDDLRDTRSEGDVLVYRYASDSTDFIDQRFGVEIDRIDYEVYTTGDPVQVLRTRHVVTATDGQTYTLFDITFTDVILIAAEDGPGNYVVPQPPDDALHYTPPTELPNDLSISRHWSDSPGQEQMSISGASSLQIDAMIRPSRGGLDYRHMQARATLIGAVAASRTLAGGDLNWLWDETRSWPIRAIWDNGRYRIELNITNVTSREQWNEDDLVALIYALASERQN